MSQELTIPSCVMLHAEAFDAHLVESGLSWDHPIVMLCRMLQMQVLQLSHIVHKLDKAQEDASDEDDIRPGESLLIQEDGLTPWLPGDSEKAFEREGIAQGPGTGELTQEEIERLEAVRIEKGQA